MRTRIFLLGLLIATHLSAQPFTIKIVADNYFAVYTGTATAAAAKHVQGGWPTPQTPATITPAGSNNILYVAASDDGSTYQGLLATVQVGNGLVPTGSPLWQVCATGKPFNSVAAAPTPASLTQEVVKCNANNSWHVTSNGPNNDNAQAAGFWGKVPQIDGTANWVWDKNGSTACAGNNGFLKGGCNPGEYLIFRISLVDARSCLAPIPNFSIDWTAGYGALVANGSSSQYEQNYFWSIQESDSSWGLKGPEINQWFTGQAGAFDLKAFFEGKGQHLKCDTYYRVKLAVSNRCVNWRDTIQLVKLKCCPGEVISLPRP